MNPPTLTTERLVLDPLREDDAPALFDYRGDPEIYRRLTLEPSSADDVLRWIQRSEAFGTPDAWFTLAVRLGDSDTLIGDLGLRCVGEAYEQAEIGYTFSPQYHGRGYATEAVRGLLDHLFGALGTHRVFASVAPDNESSAALLRRLGLRREGHLRQSLKFKGQWVDDVVYAILASEWLHREGEH